MKIARHEPDKLFKRMLKEEEQLSEELVQTDTSQPPAEQSASKLREESKIISHKIAYNDKERLDIDVTYYYSGDKGNNAWLGGTTLASGNLQDTQAINPSRCKKDYTRDRYQ